MNRTTLVWKFFFQQKWKEISWHFEEWWGAYFGISFVGGLLLQFFWLSPYANSSSYDYTRTGIPTNETLAILGLCILGFWVIVGLIILLRIIWEWLSDNWEEANKRADKEIKKKTKNRSKKK